VDGLEAEAGERGAVVRIEVGTEAGEEAFRRYDVRYTPSFLVFDAAGRVVARTSVVGDAATTFRDLIRSGSR
jgi:hypothetical protein